MRRTYVLDPLVRGQVEETRRKLTGGEATISLAEIVRTRRSKDSEEEQSIKQPFIRYTISEYEQ